MANTALNISAHDLQTRDDWNLPLSAFCHRSWLIARVDVLGKKIFRQSLWFEHSTSPEVSIYFARALLIPNWILQVTEVTTFIPIRVLLSVNLRPCSPSRSNEVLQ